MDRFYLMSVFVAVVDSQGFSGAARKLKLSPPAVTRAISELEGRLGVQLLTRTTRVVRVTDAGAQYAEDCRRILSDADEADEAAAGTNATASGHIVVTAPALFGRMYVMPIVARYLTAHPDVTASCWFVDRVVHMMDEGADIAVRMGELPDSSLHAHRVGQIRQVICAAPSYLKAHPDIESPEDLARESIISASSVNSKPEWMFLRNNTPFSVTVSPRISTTTNDSAIAAAVDGFGITRLMSYQAAPHIAKGDLQVILTPFDPPELPVHVVHREGRRPSKKVRAFVDLAVSVLSENPVISRERGG
jgi:DNA-binding transcriptional LysR family regulator